MKNQAVQYLARDVHQSIIVATLRDAAGTIVMHATVPTEARAILTLVGSAGPHVHVAFEEGTQAQWLHDVLALAVERWWSATHAATGNAATRTMTRCRSALD
jgi:hypothetical protein